MVLTATVLCSETWQSNTLCFSFCAHELAYYIVCVTFRNFFYSSMNHFDRDCLESTDGTPSLCCYRYLNIKCHFGCYLFVLNQGLAMACTPLSAPGQCWDYRHMTPSSGLFPFFLIPHGNCLGFSPLVLGISSSVKFLISPFVYFSFRL